MKEIFQERFGWLVQHYGGVRPFSRLTGLSAKTVRKYRDGKGMPTPSRKLIIIDNTNVNADWLYGMTEGPIWEYQK